MMRTLLLHPLLQTFHVSLSFFTKIFYGYSLLCSGGGLMNYIFFRQEVLFYGMSMKFQVELGNFDWKAAQIRARGEKISSTAHIFSSLHYNVSKLVHDPIPHLLQVISFIYFYNSK